MIKSPKEIDTKRKIALAILFVLALFVVFSWSSNFKKNLSKPFSFNTLSEDNKSSGVCLDGSCPQAMEENPKIKDTDFDGLSDWDELNIYNTSPYIEDTDSDGVNDRAEIVSGLDPLCGDENCNQVNELFQENNEALEEAISLENLSEDQFKEIMTSQESAQALRESLLSSGMDKETLDSISDEDLLIGYFEMLSSQEQEIEN